MKQFLLNTKHQWPYILVGFVAGAGILFFIYVATGTRAYVVAKRDRDTCRDQYPLISRSLDCITLDDNTERMHALDATLDSAAALYVREGKAKRVSIFVRDLTSQQWAGANENDVYAPASLMKLPLMMAYYKISGLDPSILSSQLQLQSADYTDTQDFKPADPLVVGKTYTVDELIHHMIIDSDNNAADLLGNHINKDILDQTFIDLGVKIPAGGGSVDYVSAKSYGGILRMLYNAAYLDHDQSEAVLEMMTHTAFPGIAQPIPSDVLVAHKFGERQVEGANGTIVTRELHDCGIVYKDPHPYLICVMTEGTNFNDLVGVLQSLSATVYNAI